MSVVELVSKWYLTFSYIFYFLFKSIFSYKYCVFFSDFWKFTIYCPITAVACLISPHNTGNSHPHIWKYIDSFQRVNYPQDCAIAMWTTSLQSRFEPLEIRYQQGYEPTNHLQFSQKHSPLAILQKKHDIYTPHQLQNNTKTTPTTPEQHTEPQQQTTTSFFFFFLSSNQRHGHHSTTANWLRRVWPRCCPQTAVSTRGLFHIVPHGAQYPTKTTTR